MIMPPPRCRDKAYPPDLPSTSVVICFFNEALSALLRTVHSVLERTPTALLHEVILVDDHSELEELQEELERHVGGELKERVKLVRNQRREGLIRGRMIGASHATGEVLVFLDSHCEVNKDWLQPLLTPLLRDHRTVVCPVIDIISADTLSYSPSPLVRGASTGAALQVGSCPPRRAQRAPGGHRTNQVSHHGWRSVCHKQEVL
ncbi:hypothetical protein F7725_002685 [Dissostichus mawsoni]|uniref:Glycosyltransferase 2-like domain-containing protein n=1 Tax=Dissostichus mawsoni TaxID=36200 RepID=A0A7J5Y327_DISMA|nr:hypothetical protein F7725_002685 [Dissostichus mawsoni]